MKITDDKDYYYVELEEDRWVYATVAVKKPCDLVALPKIAESFLTLHGVRQSLKDHFTTHPYSITPLQKRTVVAEEQLEHLAQVLAEAQKVESS